MKRGWFAAMTVSLVCLAGCKTAGHVTAKRANIITPERLSRIADRQWTLRMMIVGGNEYPLASERPSVKFSRDSTVTGFASLNRFSGSMTWDDQGNIQWRPLISTRKAGPPQLMNQESTFLASLPRVQRLSLEGIHLLARSLDEQVELVFYVPMKQ